MTRRVLFWSACLLFLALLGFAVHFGLFLRRAIDPATAQLTVAPGASLTTVSRQLEEAGIVASARYLRLLGQLHGAAPKIQAGDYQFDRPATPGEILERLVTGDVRRIRVTIPEGFTLTQIAARLEQQGLTKAGDFLIKARDPAFIATLGLSLDSLEGYLFPETYRFNTSSPAETIIREMLLQLDLVLTEDLLAAAARQGLDRHGLLTLASIVQKESGVSEEMPVIAAVFLNRLGKGMLLQSDPTVIYGIADFDGNLTRRHLNTLTPYNTYRVKGLPPGPIASPGYEALRACAFPAETPYLYFVARGDGSHVFSKTFAEHNQAVRRYQLKR